MPENHAAYQVSSSARVLIAAGGTGGHVYPAIAIADALKARDTRISIRFVGTKTHLEWSAVNKAGYNIDAIWISGFHRRLTFKNLLFPVKLASSLAQSWRIISTYQPDAVICCGGYVSGPVGWIAAKRSVNLFLQEQNSYPGVTNRLLGRYAQIIFTAFEEAERYFPNDKTRQRGNPTRSSLTKATKEMALQQFDFKTGTKTLLVLGGSGGARSINTAMHKNLPFLHDELSLQIIWQCGERYYERLHNQFDAKKYRRLRLVDFLHQMPQAYAAADLVISRAGALSCSELALTGNASILVPSPNVAGDHQTKNARSMARGGAAKLVEDNNAISLIPELVEELLNRQHELKSMQQAALKLARPNAAADIADEILEIVYNKIDK